MKATTFTCKHCGANIDVPDAPGTLSCAYCGSKHRISFHGGSVTAELIAKVKQLDEDVTRLKGGSVPIKGPPGVHERLARIEEGKRKWHEYLSSVKAGQAKESPEMVTLYKGALADLLAGYGSANGEIVEEYCNPKAPDSDPVAGYSCLFTLIGLIIFIMVFGLAELFDEKTRNGIILLAVAFIGIVAGIPFVINMIRSDKDDIARRKEALHKLNGIEGEMRRRLKEEKAV